MRWRHALLALGVLSLVASACGTNTGTTAARTGRSRTRSHQLTSRQSTTSRASLPVPFCSYSALSVTNVGAAGRAHTSSPITVAFGADISNGGQSACQLGSVDSAVLVEVASYAPIAVPFTYSGSRSASDIPIQGPIILAPNGSEHATLDAQWSGWCGQPPGPLTLQFTLQMETSSSPDYIRLSPPPANLGTSATPIVCGTNRGNGPASNVLEVYIRAPQSSSQR